MSYRYPSRMNTRTMQLLEYIPTGTSAERQPLRLHLGLRKGGRFLLLELCRQRRRRAVQVRYHGAIVGGA